MRKAAPKTMPKTMPKTASKEEPNSSDVEDIIEEGRLFIRNLPYSCTEEEIREYAQRFGEVVDVFIPLNGERKSKGYCFVTFMFPEQAAKAIEVSVVVWGEVQTMDKSVFQGRVLSVGVANVKKEEYKKMGGDVKRE